MEHISERYKQLVYILKRKDSGFVLRYTVVLMLIVVLFNGGEKWLYFYYHSTRYIFTAKKKKNVCDVEKVVPPDGYEMSNENNVTTPVRALSVELKPGGD